MPNGRNCPHCLGSIFLPNPAFSLLRGWLSLVGKSQLCNCVHLFPLLGSVASNEAFETGHDGIFLHRGNRQCSEPGQYEPLSNGRDGQSEASFLSVLPGPETLGKSPSLSVQEGQSLRLVCVSDSNPPTNVSWSRGSLTLSPSQPLDPGVLELPQVVLGDGGEVTCRAQHPSGSSHVC